MNEMIGGGGFHHIALKASNFDASLRFYVDGLGFVPRLSWGQADGRAVMLDTGDGDYLEIFAGGQRVGAPAPEGAGSLLHIALRTNDCDAATARARQAGAKITVEPKDVDIPTDPVTHVRLSFFTGPDGETIELFQNTTT
jgi:glyoxylase I family protein